MVDVIGGADAVGQAVQVVDGGQDIGDGNRAADQLVVVAAQHFLLLFHIRGSVEDLLDFVETEQRSLMPHSLHIEGEEALCNVHTCRW